MRSQLERDAYSGWSPMAWARTHLVQLVGPVLVRDLQGRAKGLVVDIAAVGLESVRLRSVGDVTQSQAGDVYAEVRFEASVRFAGKVQRRAADKARVLDWSPVSTPLSLRWLSVGQVLSVPVDVLVTFDSGGKFSELQLGDFAYGRGLLAKGPPRA
jgi:hypothetical protein